MGDYAVASTGSTGNPIVSLSDMRTHLNLSSTEDDQWVLDAIETGTRFIENMTGRAYLSQNRRLTMNSFNDSRYVRNRRIYPERTPIASSTVVTITYVDSAGTTQTLASSDYIVNNNENPSCLSEAYSATWPDTRGYDNDVTIAYTVNTTATPVTVKHALKMLVGHWYNNREAVTDRNMSDVPYGMHALLGSEMIERYG